jgi:hypothetical protein
LSDCVVVKLITGETIMASIVHQSRDSLILLNPITVRSITVTTDGGPMERTVTNPYCTLTQDREFIFDWSHVVTIKPLHTGIIAFYEKLINSFEDEFDLDSTPEESLQEPEEEDDKFLIVPDKQKLH